MSLSELLDQSVEESFCIDKIYFHLECFDLEQTLEQNVMRKLIGHLASNTTHKSAVGLLGPQPNYQEIGAQIIGHAISMYDFCLQNQSIYYKDSSMKAYKIFQSDSAEPEGLPLRSTRDNRGLTKFLTMDNQAVLKKAWTFKAEYSGAA